MLNLSTISTKKEGLLEKFSDSERTSVIYHDLFDYPLNFQDLIKWHSGKNATTIKRTGKVTSKRGFYFLEGREGLIYKKLLRKRISAKKIKIADNAAKILSFVPGVKMVAVTGSLAMENSSEDSDIDLMIVTKRGLLWTTRLLAYTAVRLFGIQTRNPGMGEQKNKLCLNIWLDERDLNWPKGDRNIYTAHEIAQIIPIVNKGRTYEMFLMENKWILNFWPNAVRINKKLNANPSSFPFFPLSLIEKFAFKLQYQYMKNKLTREVITPTRALFHPQDWARVVLGRLTA